MSVKTVLILTDDGLTWTVDPQDYGRWDNNQWPFAMTSVHGVPAHRTDRSDLTSATWWIRPSRIVGWRIEAA